MTVTQVKKWGNSYGVRIPKELLERLGIQPDTRIEIRQEQGSILLTPLSGPEWSLDELLEKVTSENIHGEINTGQPTGIEAW
jgi:antitoxin MazE